MRKIKIYLLQWISISLRRISSFCSSSSGPCKATMCIVQAYLSQLFGIFILWTFSWPYLQGHHMQQGLVWLVPKNEQIEWICNITTWCGNSQNFLFKYSEVKVKNHNTQDLCKAAPAVDEGFKESCVNGGHLRRSENVRDLILGLGTTVND